MTHEIVWDEITVSAASKYLDDDPLGLATLLATVDRLADEPRCADSVPLASPNLGRLHCGRYRLMYEVDDPARVVTVIHVGRLG